MKLNGKCKWACVKTPNTTFEPAWSIDIVINDSQEKEIRKLGLKPKVDKDGDTVIKLKRKVDRRDGTTNEAPKVVDANNEPFDKLIGNGSTVNVIFSVFEWENKFGSGVSADLKGVQVVDHVPFGDDEDFEPVAKNESAPSKPAAKKSSKADFDDDVPDFL
jgi:hypothetical protein